MKNNFFAAILICLYFCFAPARLFAQDANATNITELNSAVISSTITVINVSSDIVLGAINISSFPVGTTKIIQGDNAINLQWLNGGGNRSGFIMSAGAVSTLTLKNLQISSMSRTVAGAALQTVSSSVVTVENSVFNFNRITSGSLGGGAIYNAAGSSMVITNSVFNGNSANNYGGAIYNHDAYLLIISTDVINRTAVFSNNKASLGGSAIFSIGKNSVLDIKNVQFVSNGDAAATSYYGAVHIGTGGVGYIDNSLFKNNVSRNAGPALFIANGATATIKNSTFDSNSLNPSGSNIYSGAVYVMNTIYVDSCTFINNSNMGGWGGALTINAYLSPVVYPASYAEINNSFFQNNIGGVGGAVASGDNGTMYLYQNLFKENKAIANQGGGGGGGAVYNEGYLFINYGNKFELNFATSIVNQKGGALFTSTQWIADPPTTVEVEVYISSGNQFISNMSYKGGAIGQNTGGGAESSKGKNAKTFINGVLFEKNSTPYNANGQGGALYNQGLSNSTMPVVALFDVVNSTFTQNSAYYGGAIYNLSATSAAATISLSSSIFNLNSAYRGGVVYNSALNSYIDISDTLFSSNTSASHGGVIYNAVGTININAGNVFTLNASTIANSFGGVIYNETAGVINISNGNSFTFNSSSGSGGVIYNTGTNSKIVIAESSLMYNYATGSGGAIYNTSNASISISSAVFEGNISSASVVGNGGGAIFSNSNVSNSTMTTIESVKFINNAASYGGGAAYLTASAAFTIIRNSNFSINTSAVAGGAVYNNTKLILDKVLFTTNTVIGTAATNGEGGAVYNSLSIDILDSLFIANTARYRGGAIYNSGTTAGIKYFISSSTFLGNTSALGGAIYSGNGIVEDSVFDSNTALFTSGITGNGGAVYNAVSSTFTNTSFVLNIASGTNNFTTGLGGAVYNSSVLTLNSSSFSSNTATAYGGAIYNSGTIAGIKYFISSSTFLGNTASLGGAIYSGNGSVEDTVFSNNSALFTSGITGNGGAIYNLASSTFTNTSFVLNIASGTNNLTTGLGGAIYNSAAILTISSSSFRNNTATAHGGAIFNDVSDSIYAYDTEFSSNTSYANGGAIYNGHVTSSKYFIYSSTVSGNSAVSGGAVYNGSGTVNSSLFYKNLAVATSAATGLGGAVYNTGISTFTNTSFVLNVALGTNDFTTGQGGAIYNSNILIINSSFFSSNTATAYGGAIYNSASSVRYNVSNSTFTGNNSALGGAIYSGTGNISNSLFENNTSSFSSGITGNGGAVYSNRFSTFTNVSFVNNAAIGINNFITGVGGAVYISSVAAIYDSSFASNTATAYGGAIYNSTVTYIYGGSFSENTAGSKGGAIYNAGTLNINSSSGNIIFLNNSATEGNDIYNESASNIININGTINDVLMNGGIAGYGTINKINNGRVFMDGDSSGFTGILNQTGGTIIVSSAGRMFGGTNNVADALLNVTGASLYYTVNLSTNAVLEHYNTSPSSVTVSSANIVFKSSNAIAIFDKASFSPSNSYYILANKLENGQNNSVIFNNSYMVFSSTDYTGATKYSFNNDILDLNFSGGGTRTVTFTDLRTSSSVLNFSVGFINNAGTVTLASDKLVSLNASADTINLGIIKIVDDFDNGLSAGYAASVLSGLYFNSASTSSLATTAYEYAVSVDTMQTGVKLTVIKESGEYSLNAMNILEGLRGFNFSYFDQQPQVYQIGASLDDTSAGMFTVQGYDNDPSHSVISGVLKNDGVAKGSFFNLINITDFKMLNLTLENAYIDTSGSVLRAANTLSKSEINNVILQNNQAFDYGGALYLLSGNHTLINVFVTSNTARAGGSIYNATQLFIDSATFSFNNATSSGGAIYASSSAAGNVNILGTVYFSSNTANFSGGAVYNSTGSLITAVAGSVISFLSNNASVSGGAIMNFGNVALDNSLFTNNTADQSGGAINNSGGIFTLSTGVFTLNSSGFGGAFYNSSAFLNLSNILFSSNSATALSAGNGGGAVYNSNNAKINISGDTSFFQNTGFSGGAVFNDTSSFLTSFTSGVVIFSSNSALHSGGALFNLGNVTFSSAVFTANDAIVSGGAISNEGLSAVLSLTDSSFLLNSASTGGAVYNANNGSINLNGNISFILSTSTNNGGAIYNDSLAQISALSGSSVLFSSNITQASGGAVYNAASLNMFSTSFTYNSADLNGGALFNTGTSSAVSVLFDSNIAVNGNGGAVYNSGFVSLATSTFISNISSGPLGSKGGAVYNNGMFVLSSSTFKLNTAAVSGGALYSATLSSTTFIRSVFESNTALLGSGGAIYSEAGAVVYSTVSGSYALFDSNTALTAGGALYNAGTVFISSADFRFNKSASGGAVYNSGKLNSSGFIQFSSNTATGNTGGAVYNSGEILFSSAAFYSNITVSSGGAVFNQSGGSITATGIVSFEASTSSYGGAIYNNGYILFASALFKGNSAHSGGAVFNSGLLSITSSSFNLNISASSGGAIYAAANSATAFNQVIFDSNTALTGSGGAIYGAVGSSVSFNGISSFTYNTAQISGGALYLSQADILFAGKILFASNTAVTDSGGAIFTAVPDQLYTFNNTADFNLNNANIAGGAINSQSGRFVFNSSVTFNQNKALGGNGGAISSESSSVTFNLIAAFSSNTSAGNGGAVYVSSGLFEINGNADLNGNSSDLKGGAVYGDAGSLVKFGSAANFVSNNAFSDGGAIYASQSSVTFTSASFNQNASITGKGGAVYAYNQGSAFNGNVAFTSNTAGDNGGGAYFENVSAVFADFARFAANSSLNGGGLYADNGTQITYDNTVYFIGNHADLNGGGLYIGSATVVNAHITEFTNNTAGSKGGAVYMEGFDNNNLAVLNSEFSNDTIISGNAASGLPNSFYLEKNARLNLNVIASTLTIQDGIISNNDDTFVTKTGDGILILTSSHNYINGRLNVYEGEVKTAYATGNGDIYFENGVLHFIDNVSAINNMYAVTGSDAISICSDYMKNAVLNGLIGNGVGSFEKSGSGTVLLSNSSIVDIEKVIVEEGELAVFTNSFVSGTTTVDYGAVLSGTGTITGDVINNGIVRPGNGSATIFTTMTINGNYTENGNLSIKLDEHYIPTNNILNVKGTVDISSATSLIDLDLRYGFVINSSYTVLTSSALSGTYGGFTSLFPSIDIIITTDTKNVYVRLAFIETNYGDIDGLSHNQGQVATSIDRLTALHNDAYTNKLAKIIGTADPLDDQGKKAVFDEIAGSIYANMMVAASKNGGRKQIYAQIQEKINRNKEREEKTPCTYNIWSQVYGSHLQMQNDSNSIGDFQDNNGYFIAGFDSYCGQKNAILGYTAAFGKHDVKQNDDTAVMYDYKAGIYFGAFRNQWTFKASVDAGYQQYEVDRAQPLLRSATSANYEGYTVSASADAYCSVYQSKKLKFSPFAGLEGSYVLTEGFKENASGNAASELSAKASSFIAIDGKLGMRAENRNGFMGWYAELSGKYALQGDKGLFSASINELPDDIEIYGAENDALSGQFEGGVSFNLNKHLNLFVTGIFEQSVSFNQYTGQVGINYSW